jgi:hypothetical protein
MRRIAIVAASSAFAASQLLSFGAKAPDLSMGQLRGGRAEETRKRQSARSTVRLTRAGSWAVPSLLERIADYASFWVPTAT